MPLLKFKLGEGIKGKSRVVIDPRSLMLMPLLDIWNNDQTPTKDIANDYLCYMHIISQLDPLAPFYTSSYDEVRPLAKSQIYRNMEHYFSEEEEIMIQNAVDVYIKDNEVSEERMLLVYDKKIDQMRLELEAKNLEITRNEDPITKKITYATNAKMITDVMKEIGNILKIKKELQVQIENARVSGDLRVRANRNPSFLEKQLIKLQTDARNREATFSGEAPGEVINPAGGEESAIRGQGQPDVQKDGSQPSGTKEGNQKVLGPSKSSYKREFKTKSASNGVDEQF